MGQRADEDGRIRPYAENPFYWQYAGRPVLLLGGSVEDNLFQIPDIEDHLDLLASVGGNYVRCTMSSRDPGNVWPFEADPKTGLYDLNRGGEEYWRRLERFLDLAAERDVIVQFELWDRFDFARDPWQANPYNPRNNVNYSSQQSGLVERIDTHPGERANAFFRTVPALDGNEVVLPYQQAQVDRMLSISLRYGNCLYCMDNETNESPQWPAYWAGYVRARAAEAGAVVETTEMWDAHDICAPVHEATWRHPEIYSFCDISQNNHNPADDHWRNMETFRRRIADSGSVRPINTVKIYGANTGRYGSSRDGQERFWRNVFGGLAAARFHRPPSGLGLGPPAQAHIRAMRMLTDEMDIFSCGPRRDLLSNCSWNEAYCIANPGAEYALFFPDGGDVLLDVSGAAGRLSIRWLDILACHWLDVEHADEGVGRLRMQTPRDDGYWAALVRPA
jgi:hypothetical protein